MKCWPREREENSYTGERRNNQRQCSLKMQKEADSTRLRKEGNNVWGCK